MNIQAKPYKSSNQTYTADGSKADNVSGKPLVSDAENLTEGQVFKGEMIDIRNTEVTIGLENGSILKATLAENVNVYIGQQLFFEVKSSQGSQVEIRPFTGLGQENPAVLRALEAAGMQKNDKNTALVTILMEQGMPIDKQTLQTMQRESLLYPDANLSTIVQLHKANLLVNQENIQQLEQYQSLENRLLTSIKNLTEEFPSMFEHWTDQASEKEVSSLHQNLIKSFFFEEQQISQTDYEPDTQFSDNKISAKPAPDGRVEKFANPSELRDILAETPTQKNTLFEPVIETKSNQKSQEIVESLQNNTVSLQTKQAPTLQQLLSDVERSTLADECKELGLDQEFCKQLKEGNVTIKDFFSMLSKQISLLEEEKEPLKKLFQSQEYIQLFKRGMKEQWLLKPEDITKDTIEKFYEKLDRQSQELKNHLQDMGQEDTNTFKQVTTLRNNLEFMQQLNVNYTFFQMPLKFKDQEANSDLYVYMNKRKLDEKEGPYRAMLHLDMEILGQTDVWLTLDGNMVTAKFTLEDKDSEHIVGKHMNQLKKQLEQTGYRLQASVEPKEEENDFVKDFLEQEQSNISMKRGAFDVRM